MSDRSISPCRPVDRTALSLGAYLTAGWRTAGSRPSEYPKRTVKVKYTEDGVEKIDTFGNFRFTPFDRTPYLGTFRAGAIDIT